MASRIPTLVLAFSIVGCGRQLQTPVSTASRSRMVATAPAAPTLQVSKASAAFVLDENNRRALVTGTWEPQTDLARRAVFRPPENAVTIFCSRGRSVCYESLATLAGPLGARASPDKPLYLAADLNEYMVAAWSPTQITATSENRAVDMRLEISLVDKVAQLTVRETSARGATGADPSPQVWVIKDWFAAALRKRQAEAPPPSNSR